ncbi:MAG: ACT domain-containing protein, partial [Methanomassiliicoccaceae archaeon]|nr:ACT domain-containing protein [Methanomassiliicoccaceae archaeon]
ERVAIDVAVAAVKYLKDGEITNAINAPRGKLDPDTEVFIPLAERMGIFAQQISGNNPIDGIEITYCGELAGKQTKMLTVSLVIGIIRNMIGRDNANIINALPVAKQKGIAIKESTTTRSENYANMIELKVTSKGKTTSIRGTVFGDQPRLVGCNEFTFDAPISGDMILVAYRDSPGIIGAVGTVCGNNNINIAQMSVGRYRSDALMVMTVDQHVPAAVLKKMAEVAGTTDVKFVDLSDN